MSNMHLHCPTNSAPWPWKVQQLGPVGAPVFYIFDAQSREVARFFGHRAKENCEFFMELRAQVSVNFSKQNQYANTRNA